MKKHNPLLLISMCVLLSCKSYKNEYVKVSEERDSLIYVSDMKDSSLRLFISAFDEVEANLDTITHRQNDLEQDSTLITEIKGDQRERVNDNIRIINRLLERNRRVIGDLQEKLKSKDKVIAQLENLTNKLNGQVQNRCSVIHYRYIFI